MAKTINIASLLEKIHRHRIAIKNWPSLKSRLSFTQKGWCPVGREIISWIVMIKPHFSTSVYYVIIFKVVSETFFSNLGWLQNIKTHKDGWNFWSSQEAGRKPLHWSIQVSSLYQIVFVGWIFHLGYSTIIMIRILPTGGGWSSLLVSLLLESTLPGNDTCTEHDGTRAWFIGFQFFIHPSGTWKGSALMEHLRLLSTRLP